MEIHVFGVLSEQHKTMLS